MPKDENRSAVSSRAAHRSSQKFIGEQLVGRTLADRYVLKREIGEGGFGVVFEAKDTRLQKRVAVKVLSPAVAQNADSLTRFKQEATAAARIGHKSIVDVTDVDEDEDGLHFMVMEYIEGADLAVVIRHESPLAPVRALSIVARAAQALAAAHAHNIIHRDLKPANILLTSVGPVTDFVKILDFGISKVVRVDNADETLTGDGQVVGTPRYMAPEQGIGNRVIDGRADVYALGTILYEMVTGQVPYTGATQYEIIHNKVSRDAVPPSLISPDLEPAVPLDRLIMRALAREPDDRYTDMSEFGAAVLHVLEQIDPLAASGVRPLEHTPQKLSGRTVSPTEPSLATKVLRTGKPPTPSQRAPISQSLATPTAQTPRKRDGARSGLVAFAAVTVAVAAVAVVLFLRSSGEADRSADPPEPPAASGELERAAAGKPQPPAEDGERVEIRIEVSPPDALVEIEGVAVTENPVRLPKSEESYEVVIRAPGHRTERREIRPIASGELKVTLEPELPQRSPTRSRRRRSQEERLPDSPL